MINVELTVEVEQTKQRMMELWDFEMRPIHCSNCRMAQVTTAEKTPLVSCAAGHGEGKRVPMFWLFRSGHPYSFRAAKQCPDFRCMSDCIDRLGIPLKRGKSASPSAMTMNENEEGKS